MRNKWGDTALIELFITEHLGQTDFESKAFKLLFEREKDMTSESGQTALMMLCKYNP